MRFTKIALSLLAIIPFSLQNACDDIGGYCENVAEFLCDYDRYPIKGYCPGDVDIQCCVKARSQKCEQDYHGECRHIWFCTTGNTVQGICPGPAEIQCCY